MSNGTYSVEYGMLPIGLPRKSFVDHQVMIIISSIILIIIIIILIVGLCALHQKRSGVYVNYDRFTEDPELTRDPQERSPVLINTIHLPQSQVICKEMPNNRRYNGITLGQDGGTSFVGVYRPILVENSRL